VNEVEYFIIPVVLMFLVEQVFSLGEKYQNVVLQLETSE
jgi:hypothetical protein